MSEIEKYPNPRYIGSDNDIEDEVGERDDSTFTISSGTLTIYDQDGDKILGPVASTDARFDIDTKYLRYQLDLDTGAYSAGLYLVIWKYTSSSQDYTDEFILEVRDVPH